MFHVAFIGHKRDFEVTVDIGLRYERIEEIVNRDEEVLSKAEKAKTCTLGCELGNLSIGRQKRWKVGAVDDIPGVTASVLDSFVVIALPYVEEFSDAKRVLEVLSGDGPDSWLQDRKSVV